MNAELSDPSSQTKDCFHLEDLSSNHLLDSAFVKDKPESNLLPRSLLGY